MCSGRCVCFFVLLVFEKPTIHLLCLEVVVIILIIVEEEEEEEEGAEEEEERRGVCVVEEYN